MKDTVGYTAGNIWSLLEEYEQVSLSKVPKMLDEKDSVVYQAIGWLAREDKINYEQKGRQTLVSLNR